ncbi:MAG: hypothetical protein AAFN10_25320, partial [Bacteroidota bacterium]
MKSNLKLKNQHFLFVALGLSLLLISSTEPTPSRNKFEPRFIVKRKPPIKIKKDQTYTFGYLEVLENRAKPDGPTIQLPVYIFKSRSANPKADPVIFTVGGPGETSLPNTPYKVHW